MENDLEQSYERDMRINLTREEYDSILFAMSQIQGAVEGATDEGFLKSANVATERLYEVARKYENARVKNEANKLVKVMRERPGDFVCRLDECVMKCDCDA